MLKGFLCSVSIFVFGFVHHDFRVFGQLAYSTDTYSSPVYRKTQKLAFLPAFDSVLTSTPDDEHDPVNWLLRATSALTSYFGFVAWLDRPRGTIAVDSNHLQIRASTVPGAGLGLFAETTLERGAVLGTYPGVVLPLRQHTSKLRRYPACEGYVWRFSDNQFVIDPTNAVGELAPVCLGGNPSQWGSLWFFQTIGQLLAMGVPTTLCRINEPPKGQDVNVITMEDLEKRCVTFEAERTIRAGEELFIDYGLNYDRSRYGGG